MDFYHEFYDMDENRVFVWMTDGKIVAIDCQRFAGITNHGNKSANINCVFLFFNTKINTLLACPPAIYRPV